MEWKSESIIKYSSLSETLAKKKQGFFVIEYESNLYVNA